MCDLNSSYRHPLVLHEAPGSISSGGADFEWPFLAKSTSPEVTYLGGRFGYFLFFSVRGAGRESPRRRGGGDQFVIENPRGGGPGGAEGVGRVSAANWGIFGRGGG